ncbi:hypothetical protein HMPREF3203_01973 [Proteus mirabilis]|nr:hypothetical protein HMPREF3203_01973 [Proteus mirabilis]
MYQQSTLPPIHQLYCSPLLCHLHNFSPPLTCFKCTFIKNISQKAVG